MPWREDLRKSRNGRWREILEDESDYRCVLLLLRGPLRFRLKVCPVVGGEGVCVTSEWCFGGADEGWEVIWYLALSAARPGP